MTKEEFETARFFFEDRARSIAAGKIQRWEIVKWAVTANLSLAAASIAIKSEQVYFFLFALSVSAGAGYLLYYYNLRMTRTRSLLRKTLEFIERNGVSLESIDGVKLRQEKGPEYDREELYTFLFLVGLSTVPALVTLSTASV